MTYSLEFDARALKEWQKLGDTIRQQLKKKLAAVLVNPRVEANRLQGFADCYKIKLRSSGYRLVYQVIDHEVVVFVVAVDKRERSQVYTKAAERLKNSNRRKNKTRRSGFFVPDHSNSLSAVSLHGRSSLILVSTLFTSGWM